MEHDGATYDLVAVDQTLQQPFTQNTGVVPNILPLSQQQTTTEESHILVVEHDGTVLVTGCCRPKRKHQNPFMQNVLYVRTSQ